MSRQSDMSRDTLKAALYIVRGQPRRVERYNEARAEIMESSPASFVDYKLPDGTAARVFMPSSKGATSDATAARAAALIALDEKPEARTMRAVDDAAARIGADLESKRLAAKLRKAILLNCYNGRWNTYERVAPAGIGRSDFYERRAAFLADVARRCALE